MKTVFIATLGTTPEPIIESALQSEAQEIYVLYGRPFPDQQENPLDSLEKVRRCVEKEGIKTVHFQISEPLNFDQTLQEIRKVLGEALKGMPERLIVDYTGGTKPMVAALVQAALTTPMSCKLVLRYVEGARREGGTKKMEVISYPATITKELFRRVLEHLRGGHYELASALAEGLPLDGSPGFLRAASLFLKAWDDFNYNQALNFLKQHSLNVQAKSLCDIVELNPLCNLILRLVPSNGKMVEVLQKFRPLQERKGKLEGNWEDVPLLSADALNNASRRLKEGRFSDAALRAYRAVEISTQYQLLLLGINPWWPEYNHLSCSKLEEYRKKMNYERLPEKISLHNGFHLVACLEDIAVNNDEEEWLRNLMFLRNYCYLEHGFNILGKKEGENAIDFAVKLMQKTLPKYDLEKLLQELEHKL